MQEFTKGSSRFPTALANKSLMVAWINANLSERAGCDVNKSIVFLDQDGLFEYALPVGVPLPDTDTLDRLESVSAIRSWSLGV